jgi:hypothetical protein
MAPRSPTNLYASIPLPSLPQLDTPGINFVIPGEPVSFVIGRSEAIHADLTSLFMHLKSSIPNDLASAQELLNILHHGFLNFGASEILFSADEGEYWDLVYGYIQQMITETLVNIHDIETIMLLVFMSVGFQQAVIESSKPYMTKIILPVVKHLRNILTDIESRSDSITNMEYLLCFLVRKLFMSCEFVLVNHQRQFDNFSRINVNKTLRSSSSSALSSVFTSYNNGVATGRSVKLGVYENRNVLLDFNTNEIILDAADITDDPKLKEEIQNYINEFELIPPPNTSNALSVLGSQRSTSDMRFGSDGRRKTRQKAIKQETNQELSYTLDGVVSTADLLATINQQQLL